MSTSPQYRDKPVALPYRADHDGAPHISGAARDKAQFGKSVNHD